MTLRSPIFRKLLLSSVFLILVTLLTVDFYLTRYVEAHEVERTEQQLEAQAQILSGELEALPRAELEQWARQVYQRAKSRITIINPAGQVIAESQRDPEAMENHAQRPEVLHAMRGGRGVAVRHSATLDIDFCYLALPLSYQGVPGHVLRVAVPLEKVQNTVAEVRWRILWASLIAAGLALVVAYTLARAFSQRIAKIKTFAERLVEARFQEPLAPEPDDELGSLARSLRRMADQFGDMVESLRLESARREAILASMVEGVLAVDNELRVTFCNEAFAQAVAASTPVPERLPLVQLVRDPVFLALMTKVLVSGDAIRQKLSLAPADGRAFEVHASPLEDKSRRGVIAILHEITELERLERVRKDFVANVSHELRTPLAAIRGYAETLLDGALDDQENNRKFLQIIQAQAIRLNSIASDLSVLSELESEKESPAPERVSIRDAVELALHTVEPAATVRDVRLTISEFQDAYIMGHRIRLEQALVNLLDNAVKFNHAGGDVHLETVLTPDRKVRITVRDTGSGIPAEDLPRIFERFYRADKARSREVGGTGLGLSIVKHVTEKMDGSVTVESKPGKGSTFTLQFPEA